MKILFYNHTGKVSGAERVLLMILGGLDRERFQPVLVCPADGPLEALAEDAKVRTIISRPLKARFTWRPDRLIQYLVSIARIVREARAIIRSEAPQAVHANSIRAGLVMSATTAGLRTPIIWHVHDLLPSHPFSTAIRFFTLLNRRNRIVAVSDAVATRFRGRLLRPFRKRVPVVTIHNGIHVARFDGNRTRQDEIRRSLGVDREALLIGIVGQLTPRKGQFELIRAFADIAGDFPKARLITVGEAIFNADREYANRLRREAEQLGLSDRIQFLGAREDVPALTQAFDLSVVNSRREPFGLTVVEAMASRTPVLATSVDGICEIVAHGETGWLVNSGDHAELVAALRTLLGNSEIRSRLATCAFQQVRERFSADRLITQFDVFYRQTTSRKELTTDMNELATSRP